MLILLFTLLFCRHGDASTHWMVTEDGRIQQQMESPFTMKQPEDLVSFMRQDIQHKELKQRKEKLLQEQAEIENNEDKDVELESRHYRQDPDCRAAGKRLPDFELYASSVLPLENKDIQISDHIDIVSVPSSDVNAPNCTTAYNLPYSIHAYDHLQGVQRRACFAPFPVTGLKSTMSFLENPDNAATAINVALEKNSTSWVVYNLASFYWRMKGDSREAVECVRRALHFSPEEYKDVALVNLGNILHRAHYTINATIVMLHALEISTDFNINFFTLGNMYAVLGMYNESIHYYKETLLRQPVFKAAKTRLAAVKCQLKLQEKLEIQHTSLKRTLEELQNYKVKHEKFLEDQKRFMNQHLPIKKQYEQHLSYEHQTIKEGKFRHKCQVKTNKSSSVLVCNISNPTSSNHTSDEIVYLHDATKPIPMTAIKKETATIVRQPNRKKSKKSPLSTNQQTNAEDAISDQTDSVDDVATDDQPTRILYDWTNPSWPPVDSCGSYSSYYETWDDFPSAYIDPETRGFPVRQLLTSYINLNDGDMHPQPWESPDCKHLEVLESTPYDHIVELPSNLKHWKQDLRLQNFLLMHVNQGRVWPDDLGQRILSALQKALKEKNKNNLWLLYNLAGLYWRVYGDNTRAVECLRRSVHHVPVQHSDIPIVSLSNIMYRLGKVNNSFHLLIYALKVNDSEPATYLSMGNALQAQENVTGAVQFYSYALLLYPQYTEAYHSLLVVKCRNLTQQKLDSLEVIQNFNAATQEADRKAKEVKETTPQEESNSLNPKRDGADKKAIGVDEKTTPDADGAGSLIRDADSIISDLKNATSNDLDEKMASARELMKKLDEMRSSLGQLVNEARSTKDSDDDDESSPLTCQGAIDDVDFRYVSNATLINGFDVTQVNTDLNTVDADPVCVLSDDIDLYDVISTKNLNEGPAENQFTQALKNILGDDIASRLASALLSYPTSWKFSYLTSYFWRATGNAAEAMDCLLLSLSVAPEEEHDVIMYVISDYLALLSNYDDAIKVAMEMKHTPQSCYLIGNIHAAKGDYSSASSQYKQAMKMDPKFADSKLRHKAASCLTNS
ncbi:tetratricopeptide repeat protein 17-like isoform X2 [Clavelina lepadiformis]|uniref:Tetratricopeptide repeat protein 17 n=1 Tax=Clavelina lepadiformis TaxID=159417 RepID=A0ABP0FNB1_CLALP